MALTARTAADLDAARAAGSETNHTVKVRTFPLDLSDSTDRSTCWARECRDVDILVNNAGAIPGGGLAKVDEKSWRRAWDLKVFGYINMTRALYALMKKRRAGVIVNIMGGGEQVDAGYITGSVGQRRPDGVYPCVGGASHTRRHPRRRYQSRAGRHRSPDHADAAPAPQTQFGDAERWTELMKPLAFGRAAKPEEIAGMAAFLASDRSGLHDRHDHHDRRRRQQPQERAVI